MSAAALTKTPAHRPSRVRASSKPALGAREFWNTAVNRRTADRAVWRRAMQTLVQRVMACDDVVLFEAVEMGMLFRITLYAGNKETAETAAAAARARVAALNVALSDYLPESEINRLSGTSGQGRAVKVSDELWNVLAASQRVAVQTRQQQG